MWNSEHIPVNIALDVVRLESQIPGVTWLSGSIDAQWSVGAATG